MTEHLTIGANTLAYDVSGEGPLVVLAHGIGDSRHSYRFVAPALVAAGYRVATGAVRAILRARKIDIDAVIDMEFLTRFSAMLKARYADI